MRQSTALERKKGSLELWRALRELGRRLRQGGPFTKLHGDYVIARAALESSLEFLRSIIPLPHDPLFPPVSTTCVGDRGGELLLALRGSLSTLECKNAY